jgi:hypothetical protein
MYKRLKLKNILTEDNSGGGAVHASGSDLASFLTAGGAIDWKNIIPDQVLGKYKSSKIGKTNVANNVDGGLAHMLAMGVFSVEEVKDRLGSMGIRISDLRDQDTIDFYKATKKFKLIFSLEEEIEGFFNGEKNKLEGIASVDERSNAKAFVMYFTYEGDGVTYKMIFDPKTLQKNVKGADFDLPMLINNEIYYVKFSKEESGEREEDEETKKESLKMSFVLDDLILEKKLKDKRNPPKGSMVGKGEGLDLSFDDSQSQERKIIINKIPTHEGLVGRFSGEDDIDPIFVGGIDITDDGGNSTWSLGNVESKLNQLLKNGVKIRPSKKDKDNWLVVYWSKPYDFGDSKGTEAMLISPKGGDVKSFLQKITSTGVVDEEVEVGKKVAGNEDITNPSKGKITLRPKI